MMKTISILVLLILSCSYCNAQYYEVNDPDGYVNVRTGASANSDTVCRLPNSTIVYEVFDEEADPKNNWVYVNFYLKKNSVKKNKEDYTLDIMTGFSSYSGYIYRSKLKEIEKLSRLKYKQLKTGYTCFNDSITINVQFSPFVSAQHKIKKNADGFYEKIDNLPIVGTDGDLPREEIRSITVTINKTAVTIPAKNYKNLFQPSYDNYTYTDGSGSIYVVMYNSDAAGSYTCIFIIRNGKFIERLVFEGDC